MPLFQITKFFLLAIFIFFISCGLNAQNSAGIIEIENQLNQSNNNLVDENLTKNSINKQIENIKKEDSNFNQTKSDEITKKENLNSKQSLKNRKNIKSSRKLYKSIKTSRKSNKFSKNKLKKKLNKKVLKKPLSKKSIKNSVHKILDKKPEFLTSINSNISVDDKNLSINQIENYQKASTSYLDNVLIEVELDNNNCNALTESNCLRSDKFFQKPYFHYTLISIFKGKVIAEQYFEENSRDKIFLKINDGKYSLLTKKQNKIFLSVKNGLIEDLIMIKGNFDKEIKISSKCQYSHKLYAHHQLYDMDNINVKKFYYSNKNNFKGLIEGIIFNEKHHSNATNLYSIFKIPNKEFRPIRNIKLCKIEDDLNLLEINYTKDECSKKFDCIMETLEKYNPKKFLELKNKYPQDFDKLLVKINYSNVDELVAKDKTETVVDIEYIKSKCFYDKNIDLIECSKNERCIDYLTIENCEVKYIND